MIDQGSRGLVGLVGLVDIPDEKAIFEVRFTFQRGGAIKKSATASDLQPSFPVQSKARKFSKKGG